MSEILTSLERIKKIFATAKTLHCGVSELEWGDVREVLDDIASIESELAESGAMEKRLVEELEYLQSQLAATKALLAAYEEGFDPAVKLPDKGNLVTVLPKDRFWQSYTVFDGEKFAAPETTWDVYEVARWFPLPGSKGGEE